MVKYLLHHISSHKYSAWCWHSLFCKGVSVTPPKGKGSVSLHCLTNTHHPHHPPTWQPTLLTTYSHIYFKYLVPKWKTLGRKQKPFTLGYNNMILLFTFEKKAFRLYRLALAWCGGVPPVSPHYRHKHLSWKQPVVVAWHKVSGQKFCSIWNPKNLPCQILYSSGLKLQKSLNWWF